MKFQFQINSFISSISFSIYRHQMGFLIQNLCCSRTLNKYENWLGANFLNNYHSLKTLTGQLISWQVLISKPGHCTTNRVIIIHYVCTTKLTSFLNIIEIKLTKKKKMFSSLWLIKYAFDAKKIFKSLNSLLNNKVTPYFIK